MCALTRTQVLLDASGRALGRAILFRDRRAAAVARELDGATAFDARARLAWIERHQPARFAKIATVVEPKDYLNLRLTGVIAADTVTRSREPALPLATRNVVAPWQQVGVVKAERARGLRAFPYSPARSTPGLRPWGPAPCPRARPTTWPAPPKPSAS